MVKCTLGVYKRPRLQPCKPMKDEPWPTLPSRQERPLAPPTGAVRGHEDKKQLFSKHQYPSTRHLPTPKVTLF